MTAFDGFTVGVVLTALFWAAVSYWIYRRQEAQDRLLRAGLMAREQWWRKQVTQLQSLFAEAVLEEERAKQQIGRLWRAVPLRGRKVKAKA